MTMADAASTCWAMPRRSRSRRTPPHRGRAGDKKAIDDRIGQIKAELERVDSDFDREKLQERLAKLSGGVAVLKVGAATESELKEKKSRIEDALQATRAAVEEGIVAGGGTAYVNAVPAVEKLISEVEGDEKTGVRSSSRPCSPRSVRLQKTPAWTALSSSRKLRMPVRSATASTPIRKNMPT